MKNSYELAPRLVILALALALPMCDSDDESSNNSTTYGMGGTTSASGGSLNSSGGSVNVGTGGEGGTPTTGVGTGGTASFSITISNFNFVPLNLTVTPGATVTVTNQDSVSHSVTSESSMNNFQPGAVNGVSFDTGVFGAGTRTFTISASATAGTVVPYYCSVHTSGMPQGTVTIQ